MSANSSARSFVSPPVVHGNAENLYKIIGNLAQVQSDLKIVVTFLDNIVSTENDSNKTIQKQNIEEIINERRGLVLAQLSEIVEVMKSIHRVHEEIDVVPYRGDITDIENLWSEINSKNDNFDSLLTYNNLTDAVWARNLSTKCKNLRRAIGLFTIPKRIREFVWQKFGVGAPFDFHEEFKEELPDANDRVIILRTLAALNVNYVGGLVDIERGMIYRIGPPWRQRASWLGILGMMVLGWILIYILNTVDALANLNLAGFQGENSRSIVELTWAYVCTMLGTLGHIWKKAAELSTVEKTKGSDEPVQVILDRLYYWIHVREYRFGFTIVLAMIVFSLLVIDSATLPKLDATTLPKLDFWKFLFAGYMVDSVSEPFVKRFDTAVSAYAKEVKQALAPAATS